MNTFNYRILTRFQRYDAEFAKAIGREGDRVFAIHTVYYTDDVAHSYSATPEVFEYESVESMRDTHNKIAVAMGKPVLDMDNFPNEFME